MTAGQRGRHGHLLHCDGLRRVTVGVLFLPYSIDKSPPARRWPWTDKTLKPTMARQAIFLGATASSPLFLLGFGWTISKILFCAQSSFLARLDNLNP